MNKYERSKHEPTPIGKLLRYLKNEKALIIVAIIFSALGALSQVSAPLVLKTVSEMLLNGQTSAEYVGKLWTYAGIAIGLYAGYTILTYVCVYIISGVCARCGASLRREMITKYNKLPLNYFDSRNIGDILSYVSNDVDIVSTTLQTSFSSLMGAVVTLFAVTIILFVLQWQLGLVTLICLPIVVFVLTKVSGKSQQYFVKRSELTSEVSAQAEESYTGFNIIRVFQATDAKRDAFSEKNFKLQQCMSKADFYSGAGMPIVTFFGNLIFCVIALVGSLIASKFTVGSPEQAAAIATIVAAVSYSNQIISPLTTIASTFATLQQTSASAKRIFDFLAEENEPDESDKTVTIENVKGNIEFEHVKFGYTKDRVIIHDFCEVGKPGQKIAIVGPTGAGKTTMVNLLMRFYEVNSGSIKIEGIDTKTMNRGYVRSLFGMVLQDTWLFEGTIMENLKYSRPDASDEEVYAACKATHCDVFIRQQPNGYDHILNEDCGLSAGQKQLLTIARAMIQNAPMLILDEATSSVDTRTEALIQDAMDALMKGRTSFVIAHRLSTIKNSDLIIVMKDGDVIETGNHDQLMKKDGFYASLYNAQFTGEGPQFS